MESRIKELSELPDLSRMDCEPWGMPKNWGYCQGHKDLDRNQWAITHVHEDLSEDVYPLPLWVTPLIRAQVSNAQSDLQRDLRNLLGL